MIPKHFIYHVRVVTLAPILVHASDSVRESIIDQLAPDCRDERAEVIAMLAEGAALATRTAAEADLEAERSWLERRSWWPWKKSLAGVEFRPSWPEDAAPGVVAAEQITAALASERKPDAFALMTPWIEGQRSDAEVRVLLVELAKMIRARHEMYCTPGEGPSR